MGKALTLSYARRISFCELLDDRSLSMLANLNHLRKLKLKKCFEIR